MKKIVRLTESELVELVKKVLVEQEFDYDMVSSFSGRKRVNEPETKRNDNTIIIKGASENEVSEILGNISNDILFISIVDCEFADFDGVEICSTNLVSIKILGTPSNFKSQGYDCIEEELGDGIYLLNV